MNFVWKVVFFLVERGHLFPVVMIGEEYTRGAEVE